MLLKVSALESFFKKYPSIREEFKKTLIKDARECELDFNETKSFVEESISSPDSFEYFMPQYQEKFNTFANI